jgi:hypothetical protein
MDEQLGEPTILDRLNNAMALDRDVQRGLLRYAEGLLPELLEEGFTLVLTRDDLRKRLTQWLYSHGFTGRSNKKLIDKTAAKVLRSYEADLRQKLRAKARRLRKEGWWGECQAKAINAALDKGVVGKVRDRRQLW